MMYTKERVLFPSPLLCQHISSRPVNTNTDFYIGSHSFVGSNRYVLFSDPFFYEIRCCMVKSFKTFVKLQFHFSRDFVELKFSTPEVFRTNPPIPGVQTLIRLHKESKLLSIFFELRILKILYWILIFWTLKSR